MTLVNLTWNTHDLMSIWHDLMAIWHADAMRYRVHVQSSKGFCCWSEKVTAVLQLANFPGRDQSSTVQRIDS